MAEIDEFEALIGFQLPKTYREFLEKKNGGSCKPEVILLDNGEEVLCDNLYGFTQGDALNLIFWNREFAGELPGNCIVIGDDPGGGMFLLIKRDDEWRIMYWDHQYYFQGSSDEQNAYIAHISLSGLLGLAGYGNTA